MFADLLNRLFTPEPETLPADDSRLALAALLVRVARSDGDYAAEEIEQIKSVLESTYALQEGAAAELLTQGEQLEAEAPDTVRFTNAIKHGVPYEHRVQVIEALWRVVLADGVRDAEEDALLRMVAPMLGVSDQDSAKARHRVSS